MRMMMMMIAKIMIMMQIGATLVYNKMTSNQNKILIIQITQTMNQNKKLIKWTV